MTSVVIDPATQNITLYLNEGTPGVLDTSSAQSLTNKTLNVDSNTFSGFAASSFAVTDASGNLDGAAAQKVIPAGAVVGTTDTQTLTNKTLANPALGNTDLTGIKTATFSSQTVIATTSGAITLNWTTAQHQKQTEPTGSITYTFTAPTGPCHLQLLIDSDGTSTAQTIVWPGTVVWLTTTWAGVNNKKAVLNFWFDGTTYFAMGSNQV